MTSAAAEVGSTTSRYEIVARLAVGGMAEIFLVRGLSVAGVERYCVLKRIVRERASDMQLVQMFLDEARLVAQLRHPNIASVYDVGMLGDSYFFTMEYVHGETVRSLFEHTTGLRRSLSHTCVLTIIIAAAAGLHHAHERSAHDGRPLGIVHRDVSPSNLMVSFEGNVKVVDFGVAKAAGRAVETQSGTVKGKISYLSPEQCRRQEIDRRSDLFSLGIVMWEMLTGIRLYQRGSDFDVMAAIVEEVPPAPSSLRADVPLEVDAIVLRLLAKSVTERFQTAAEVVEALENAAMRAGMMPSTSAVSRLMVELFGARREPWLGAASPSIDPVVTRVDRPLPKQLGESNIALLPGLVDVGSSTDTVEIAFPAARSPDGLQLSRVEIAVAEGAVPLAGADSQDERHSGTVTAVIDKPVVRRRAVWPVVSAVAIVAAVTAVVAWGALGGADGHARVASRTPETVVSSPSEAKTVEPPFGAPLDAARLPVIMDPPATPAAMPTPAAPGDSSAASRAGPTPRATIPRPTSKPRVRPAKWLRQLYDTADYSAVVRACREASVTAAIAEVCTLAACQLLDAVDAQRWLSINPPSEREKVVAACQHLGNNDIHNDGDIPKKR